MDRPLHGKVGCSTWIETFNLSRRSGAQPIGNRCVPNDRIKVLTLVARQRFRVTYAANELAFWHEDCTRNDRPGEWGEPNFVNANNGTCR